MIITEIQNSPEWYSARRGQIRATDFSLLYKDIVDPKPENKRRSAINKIIDDKVHGKMGGGNLESCEQGHQREYAILMRMNAVLGLEFEQNCTVKLDNNIRIAGSLDGLHRESFTILESKTIHITSPTFLTNLRNNIKNKWRGQAIHNIFCFGKDHQKTNLVLAVEFQQKDFSGNYTRNKDFFAMDFKTGKIIVSDFEQYPEYKCAIEDMLCEMMVWDNSITQEIWEQTCVTALDALDFEFSKIEF